MSELAKYMKFLFFEIPNYYYMYKADIAGFWGGNKKVEARNFFRP